MLSYFLGAETYEMVSAHTFVDGLAKGLAEKFDAILLDSRLPDGSGLELCRQIRTVNQQTPIIFYSADAYPNQIEEAMQAGATLYLKQPLAPDAVETALQIILQSK
jgi:DNA-binding response OmpR family regulator